MPRRLAILVIAGLMLLPTFAVAPLRVADLRAADSPAFTVTTVPIDSAVDINDRGQVLGLLNNKPVVWEQGKPLLNLGTDLPIDLQNAHYAPVVINNSGVVAGYLQGYRQGEPGQPGTGQKVIPIVWEQGIPRALPTPFASTNYVIDMNDVGQILGYGASGPGENISPPIQIVRWDNYGQAAPVQLPIGADAGRRINNRGQIATGLVVNNEYKTGIWQDGQFTEPPPPPGAEYYDVGIGNAINNLGHVIAGGTYYIGGAQYTLEALLRDGTYLDVDVEGSPEINDHDQIVSGYFDPVARISYLYLWQAGHSFELHTLISPGWVLQGQPKINNQGQILIAGSLNGGPLGPVVLTPTGVPLFGDIPAGDPAATAIAELNARGIIRGCDVGASPPLFCPDERTLRSQMAGLIVRAVPGWAGETYANTFTDKGVVDDELWRRVATLQHYGVANGYNDCAAVGLTPPCYGPTDPVNRAQAISFVTRALVKKGYWQDQPVNAGLYGGALLGTGHEQDASTYWHYTRAKGGVPDYPEGGSFPVTQDAPRGWFARLLWTALQDTPVVAAP